MNDEEYIDNSVCAKGRCKQWSTIIYLNTPLCEKHWQMLCDKQDKEYEKKKKCTQ